MLTRRELFRRLGGAVIGVSVMPAVAKAALADYDVAVALTLPPPVCDFATMFKVGDVFTRDGCYAMDPLTRSPSKELAQFRVMSVSSGEMHAMPVWDERTAMRPKRKRRGSRVDWYGADENG